MQFSINVEYITILMFEQCILIYIYFNFFFIFL